VLPTTVIRQQIRASRDHGLFVRYLSISPALFNEGPVPFLVGPLFGCLAALSLAI
jgi:hypothetical protein